MKILTVFDLDGVLIDSQDIIREAYRCVGVHPPSNILEYERKPWLAAQVGEKSVDHVRRLKNVQYLSLLAHGVKTLPPFTAACQLASKGYAVSIMTAAPYEVKDVLQHVLPMWPFRQLIGDVRTSDKMKLLENSNMCGVYVDDQAWLVKTPSNFAFIHYVGQDAVELHDSIVRVCDALKL